jgi:hypothetical protein
MTIDYTIHIQDILFGLVTLVVLPLLKILVTTIVDLRDQVKELNFKMGSQSPPFGVLGEMQSLKDKILEHDKTLVQYRDWLIQIQDRRKKDGST